MERAKELYLYYGGNRYYMSLNGDEKEYDGYNVPKETEEVWRREYLDRFFETERTGRAALASYANAVSLLRSDRSDNDRDRFLYYPLERPGPDDVTVLFMLPYSFRLAERWAKKGCFTRREADGYLQELKEYSREVQSRMRAGTMTRSEDYTLGEFSDPEYVAGYLESLRQKWAGLV